MKKVFALLLVFFASLSACAQVQKTGNASAQSKPEIVSIYLMDRGKTGDKFLIASVPVVYPERKCPFDELAGHQNMVAATITNAPRCSLLSGDDVFFVSPYSGVQVYKTAFFVVARVNGDGTATIVQPNFDGTKVMKAYQANQQAQLLRSLSGAPLPPRGSSN